MKSNVLFHEPIWFDSPVSQWSDQNVIFDDQYTPDGTDLDTPMTGTEDCDIVRPTRYPAAAQWEEHRQLITKLYSVQNRTLVEVMQHMKTQHDFVATENMYKKRIKKWSLDKKFKRHEAVAMLLLLDHYRSTNRTPAFFIRGKQISKAELERYVKRAHINARELFAWKLSDACRLAPDLVHRPVLQDVRWTRPTDETYALDSIRHVIVSYLNGAFDAKLCWVDRKQNLQWKSDCTQVEAWRQLRFGIRHYRASRFVEAGTAWRIAFLKLEALVTDLDPRAWLVYVDELLQLRDCGARDIGTALRKHLLALIATKLDTSCPNLAFASSICSLDYQQAERYLSFCQTIMFDTWKSYLSPYGLLQAQLEIHHDFPKHLKNTLTIDPLRDRLADYKSRKQTTYNIRHCITLQVSAYNICRSKGDWRAAQGAAQDIVDSCSALETEDEHCMTMFYGLSILATAYRKLKMFQLAKSRYIEALDWYVWWGETSLERTWSGYEISRTRLYEVYNQLDWLSNFSPIADGDQQWCLKLRDIEREWEDNLAADIDAMDL